MALPAAAVAASAGAHGSADGVGSTSSPAGPVTVYHGSCHCQQVRWRVTVRGKPDVIKCNCSVCTKKGFLHLIVPETDFELLSGADQLTLYQFNTKTARHLFCRHCGVQSFYRPRSHPHGVDVNALCIDSPPLPVAADQIALFDGRNWEKNIAALHEAERASRAAAASASTAAAAAPAQATDGVQSRL